MIEINHKKDCTGCYACENICPQHCIDMNVDDEGFWYPQINMEICVNCGLCEKACPVLCQEQIKNEPKAYACYNKDEIVRIQSSSGGLFSLFSEHVIENGGIVFGASFDEDFSTIHICTDAKQDLEEIRGSKYVQSKIGDVYKQVKKGLSQGKQVLFTGTPCQIAGLKAFLQNEYDNLLCIDNICHGVPSPKVWKKYVSYQEGKAGNTARIISFRRKDKGWKQFSISFLFKDETEYIQTFDKDLYMKAYLKNICLRPSCYECKFKTLNRHSDITLADFWGVQSLLPEMDDDKGISLIIINSAKGSLVFDKIKNCTLYKEVNLDKAVYYNSAAVKSVKRHPKRKEFFMNLDRLSFDNLVSKYCTDSFASKAKKKVRALIYSNLMKQGSN